MKMTLKNFVCDCVFWYRRIVGAEVVFDLVRRLGGG